VYKMGETYSKSTGETCKPHFPCSLTQALIYAVSFSLLTVLLSHLAFIEIVVISIFKL